MSDLFKTGTRKIDGRTLDIGRMSRECVEDVKQIEIECRLESWTTEDYRAEIAREDAIALIARLEKKIVGFLIARLIMSDAPDSQASPEKINSETPPDENSKRIVEAEIYNIAVGKNFQNRGIGQALIDDFLDRSKKRFVSRVWLEVRASNERAIDFYQKNNFAESYRRKSFYSAPSEDAIVMSRHLSPEK